VADLVGEAPPEVLARRLDDAHTFLAHHLIPHAHAEERALYPAVERVMQAEGATATMSRDHGQVSRLTDELSTLLWQIGTRPIAVHEAKALRRVLYGLYALITGHFAKEEDVYLPLLDERLTDQEAIALFEAMAAHA
jgi:iron-sulfur cluster repair protein YtfE (RIC family)